MHPLAPRRGLSAAVLNLDRTVPTRCSQVGDDQAVPVLSEREHGVPKRPRLGLCERGRGLVQTHVLGVCRDGGMAQRMIEANGVELCAEAFGDPRDPPILLIMGIGASMLWWEEGFCGLLADGGRFVIRYDHRDTGRSVTYEPGRPEYGGADLVADAAGVLDAYDLAAAHIVGVSAGGAFAQLLALDAPDRVLSLILISTSPAVPSGRALPPPTEAFGRFVSTARVDWSDADSVIEYLVEYARVLAGAERPFEEEAARELIRRDIERARHFAALQNHDSIPDDGHERRPLSSMVAPTLVVHGTADPMFPAEHGEALAEEIPGARRLRLEGAGHGVDRHDWEILVRAILEQTAQRLGE